MNFRQVIEKYGYPFIGKEVAGCVYGARRYMEKLMERERGNAAADCRLPGCYEMADLAGIDHRADKENELYRKLVRGEIPSADIRTPIRYLMMQGKYPHKDKGAETSEYSRMFNKERYRFFLEAPFELSDNCCYVMKKSPMKSYCRRTGRVNMTAQMASESRLRMAKWLENGCNGFHMKNPISNPMAFWTEQDVLEYIYHHQIPIAAVYGKVLKEYAANGKKLVWDGTDNFASEKSVYRTSGCSRNGCVFCGFGVHREKSPNRWGLAEELSNPALIDYMQRGGDFDEKGIWKPDDRGLGFWFVIEWINTHGNLNIAMPHREEYIGRYMTSESRKQLAA